MQKKFPPAFLFDLDGVLIDSREGHWAAWQQLKNELPEIRSMDRKQFLATFGQSNDSILKHYLPDANSDVRKKWGERKEAWFRKEIEGTIQLLPGMENFLKSLKELPKIIASSTPLTNLHFLLETTILGQYFTRYVSAEEVVHGKPAPDVFLEAAKRLQTPIQEAIVFEDSLAGLQAGKAAGAFVVGLATTVPWTVLQESKLCHLVYESPSQLSVDDILQARDSCSFTS